MAGFDAPPPDSHDDHPEIAARNSRNGLILFAVYLIIYGGFVGLSAFAPPSVMAAPALAGVNLAIIYGFGLIVSALVLAAIYMYLCRPAANATTDSSSPPDSMTSGAGEGKAQGS